jgi:hypothetical protein
VAKITEQLGFKADNIVDIDAKQAGKLKPTEFMNGNLARRYGVPPFSVLDAGAGNQRWQKRKKFWIKMGIESELGRDVKVYTLNEKWRKSKTETSVFDPVLCELMYRWFSPPNGQVIDPFAGGSVRGIVAHCMGRQYWGCELREEQVQANIAQGQRIVPKSPPLWTTGDSRLVDGVPKADFIFSCPPYGDLEVYSEQEADLSNMDWGCFAESYHDIVRRFVKRLRKNRFACFVVANYRDKASGILRDLVGLTVRAFEEAGASYYNDAILVTPVGSLPIRTERAFEASRKLGKQHQNILVFCKGDPKKATEVCGGENSDDRQ